MAHTLNELRDEYENLFASCEIRPERLNDVKGFATKAIANKDRYQVISELTDVPWYIIAAIHLLEATQNFNTHLHNGDPLTAKTVNVPKNRPPFGSPPFKFNDSAVDALFFEKFDRVENWTLPGALFNLERYNGFGTRDRGIHTPYLWSFSKHYTKGKFTSDGVFNPNAVSQQCGAAVLLKKMVSEGAFAFPVDMPPSTADEIKTAGAGVPFSNQKTIQATRLQKLLNRFPGISARLSPDGVPGKNTSAAFREVTGSFLAGDPRATA